MKKIVETPIMKQYKEMKKKHPDAVLLFRVGDFYECFGDDAVVASKILGITLTRRANGSTNYIELSGFPHHALDTYLPKLIRAGKRVAICEQLEDPKITKTEEKNCITELVNPYIKPKPIRKSFDISCLISVISEFFDIIYKLYTFDEIRRKTQEIRELSKSLGLSPKKAFEECNSMYQPYQQSLFD